MFKFKRADALEQLHSMIAYKVYLVPFGTLLNLQVVIKDLVDLMILT